MPTPMWAEYARVQSLVEAGKAKDRQLDTLLKRYIDDGIQFGLRDCRRRLKNCERNTRRGESRRDLLLRRRYVHLVRPSPLAPPEGAALVEARTAVRQAAGRDWPVLRKTVDGDYDALAQRLGMPMGTLKSQVSRTRARMREVLAKYAES